MIKKVLPGLVALFAITSCVLMRSAQALNYDLSNDLKGSLGSALDNGSEKTAESTGILRWKPCRTLNYTIDVTDAPMQWIHDVHDAFKDASRATGIPVHYTGRWPHDKTHETKDPVLIYYKSDPDFAAHGAIAYTQPFLNPSHRRIIGGYIIVDPKINNTSHTIHMRALYHEVGHIFGLPHPGYQYWGQSVMGGASAPYKPFDYWMFSLVGRQKGEC